MTRLSLSGTLCALLLFASPAGAQIYSWTDAEGNRVYSDQPRPGARTVELAPTNVIEPAPIATPARNNAQSNTSSGASFYRELSISSPAHDSNIRIAPSFPLPDELQKATELLCTVTRLVSLEKLLGM